MTDIEMVKCKLNDEFEIIIPKHRADRPDWYTEQGWEKARLKSMSEHLGKGDNIYYIGAEEGEMPALCQMWGADVFLFEPNPAVWPNIKAIWTANKLKIPNIIVGFASNVDKMPDVLNYDKDIDKDGWPVIASEPVIGNHGFKELYLEADNYPQVKIDTIVNRSKYPPTALSIDVEGSEFEVLKGARQTIAQYKPKIWLSLHPEFLIQQWGVYGRDVRNWIIDLGYKETLLDYQHECHLLYEPL